MLKHGHRRKKPSPTYVSWKMMLQRCTNPKREDYSCYGGAGVGVYFGWMGPEGFETFLRDVGERPSRGHVLGRIDHTRDYEPGNVQWVVREKNCSEIHTASKMGEVRVVDGEERTLGEWADYLGLKYSSLLKRLWRGWGDDAFRVPREGRRRHGERKR